MTVSAQQERVARLVSKLGLPADQIVRDLVQSRLISAIFSQKVSRRLALKGGFAMQMYCAVKRSTKDIDLQADPKMPMAAVAKIVREGIADALASGFIENFTVSEPKQTETVQRWKIQGTVAGGQSSVHLTLEISRRGMPNDDLLTERDFIPPVESGALPAVVTVFSPAQMFLSKMAALASPNRVAARDVWDLNSLFDFTATMRIEPPIALLAELGPDHLISMQKAIDEKLGMITWQIAKEQLVPFLPRKIAQGFDEDAWDFMCARVSYDVGLWIDQALAARGPQ